MREKKRKYRILIFWASLVGEENEEHNCENSSETLASMVGLEIFPTCSSEGGARMIFGWEIDWLQLFFFFEERLWLALGGGKWMEMFDSLMFFVFDFLVYMIFSGLCFFVFLMKKMLDLNSCVFYF